MKRRRLVVIALLLLAPIFQSLARAADPNLSAYWKFDESTGITAYDSAGNHNGLLYGATWTPDSYYGLGNALSFDGNDEAYIGNIGLTEDWTVCFWAKSSDNTGSVYYPIGLGNPRSGVVMGGTSPTVTQQIVLYDSNNSLKSSTEIETGTWYHIAITKSATTYSIYVNGVCEKIGALSDIDLTNFGVGSRPDWIGYFKGNIDDVGVWDCALVAGDLNDPDPGTINYVRLNGIFGPGYGNADNPNPSHMQTNVKVNTDLKWRAGEHAADVNGHKLYFSKYFNDVNSGTADCVVLTEPNYSPAGLDYATVYYWRVDEINDPCTWQGRVWKFTTTFGEADPNLFAYWKFDESSGTTAYDSAGNHNGLLYGATWTPDSRYSYGNALSFDGNDEAYIGNIGLTEDWTVCFWAKSSDNTGAVYYPIGLGNPNAGVIMGGTSPTITQHIALFDGANSLKSSTEIETGTWYHIAITKSATTYSIYVNGVCEKIGALSDIDLTNFVVGIRPDAFGYFKGTIDDVGIWDCALVAGDLNDPDPGTINYVRLNGIFGPGYGNADNPNPSHMQTNVNVNVNLRWRAGERAADVNGHRIYFSKIFNDVNSGAADCVILTEPNYNPAALDYATVYYWRVDEINDSSMWQGCVWKFTTTFGAVDPNLISNWRFDKGSGTVAFDSMCYRNGTINWATWTSDGQFGNALNFIGNAYVNFGDMGIINDWTVCFWAKSSNNSWTVYYPIGLGNPNMGVFMGGTGSTVRQHIGLYDGTNSLKSSTSIQTGIWYHIAITKSTTTYSIYVNGVCEKTGALKDIDLSNFMVGARSDFTGYFQGTIDDVGIWNCALAAGDRYDPNPGTINYVRLNTVSGPGYGIAWNPLPIDKEKGVDRNTELKWRPVAGDVNEHRVYLSTNFESVQDGTAGYVSVNEPNYDPGILEINTTYYWRVDEVIGPDVWQGLVWRFTTRSGEASGPYPANNAFELSSNIELGWMPGYFASDTNGHDVFFGTSLSDVERGCGELLYDIDGDGEVNYVDLQILCEQWLWNVEGMNPKADLNGDNFVNLTDYALMAYDWKASGESTACKGRQTDNRYNPGNLDLGVTYYWRIDEYNEPNVWPGQVWNFTIGIDTPLLTNAPTYQITPTYDGSGQAMHPDVLYFPDGWNGHKYWMAMTPFTYSQWETENPSILVGDDGLSWELPAGLTNPVIWPPNSESYNADPELVYNDDTNEIWLYFIRYWSNTLETKLALMKSADGINWTEPEYLLSWFSYNTDNDRSPTIIKQGNDWYYWAQNGDAFNAINYRHSTDGENWSAAQDVVFSTIPEDLPWHLSVIYVPDKSEYWMLYNSPGGPGSRLYFAKSKNRVNWTGCLSEVLSPSAYGWDNYVLYRPVLLYDSTNQLLRIWYSAKNYQGQWHTGYTETQY